LVGVQENVLRELADVRGGGAAALNMIQRGGAGQQRQLERDERMAMIALQRGDLVTYRFYAARAGIELPEEVLHNAQQRGLLADAGLMAARFYPRQQSQQQRFVETYLQTGGDLSAARTAARAAGPSGNAGSTRQPPQPRPTRQSQVWRQGANPGEEELVMVDPTNPNAPARAVTDQNGSPVTRRRGSGQVAGPRATAEPRLGARQQQEQMLIRAGVDPQEAARIAGGAQASANTIASVYLGLVRSGASRAEIDGAMEVFGPNWRRALGGAAAVAPPAPAPAAAPQSGSSWLPSWLGGSSAPRVAPQEAPAPAAPLGQSGMQAEPPPAAGRSRIRVNENGEIVY
jgi:hypothetical protein